MNDYEKDQFLTALLIAVLVPFPLGLILAIVDVKTNVFTDLFRRVFNKS